MAVEQQPKGPAWQSEQQAPRPQNYFKWRSRGRTLVGQMDLKERGLRTSQEERGFPVKEWVMWTEVGSLLLSFFSGWGRVIPFPLWKCEEWEIKVSMLSPPADLKLYFFLCFTKRWGHLVIFTGKHHMQLKCHKAKPPFPISTCSSFYRWRKDTMVHPCAQGSHLGLSSFRFLSVHLESYRFFFFHDMKICLPHSSPLSMH